MRLIAAACRAVPIATPPTPCALGDFIDVPLQLLSQLIEELVQRDELGPFTFQCANLVCDIRSNVSASC